MIFCKGLLVIVFLFWSLPALAATYYVKNAGSDAASGLTSELAWKTINKVNISSFSAGDSILFNKGDIWREQLTIPSSGSAVNQITFSSYGTGNAPIISGATSMTSWLPTTYCNCTKWKCYTSAPTVLWFQEGTAIKQGKAETTLAALDAKYDWYHDGTYLYIYSITNPNSAFTAIEGAIREAITATDKDYITISNLDLRYAQIYGIRNISGSHWNIDGNIIHHVGTISQYPAAEGISIDGGFHTSPPAAPLGEASDNIIQNNNIYECGRHGVNITTSNGTCLNNLIEKNIIYNCYHTGIDFQSRSGTHLNNIIRYNKIYADSNYGDITIRCNGIFTGADSGATIDSARIYYNLFYNLPGYGIIIDDYTSNTQIYNNTIGPNNPLFVDWQAGIRIETNSSATIIKNNIITGYSDYVLQVKGASSLITAEDNNLLYQTNDKYVELNGIYYHADDLAAYRIATGFETNGIWNDNPDFVSATDFHLQTTSPAKNTGVDVSLTPDLDDIVVPQGGTPDMGCYEFH